MINVKAQGSLEYLLIIGVVILIAAVVIGAITGVLSFGRLSASKEQADSVYTGLQDVMDLSKGRTILNLKLKRGENVLEFNDTVEKTIWTIFQRLPINTQIIFIGAKNCSSISDGQIDANKKIDGQGTAYFQNQNGASTSTIVNQCVVPKDTKVTINVPDTATDEELNLQVPIEKEGEIYLEITSGEDLNRAIWENPSGNYKLRTGNNIEYYLEKPLPKFSGILDANYNYLSPKANFNFEYYFEELNGGEIKNLGLINPTNNPQTGTYYLAKICTNQNNAFLSLINPDVTGGYLGPCRN